MVAVRKKNKNTHREANLVSEHSVTERNRSFSQISATHVPNQAIKRKVRVKCCYQSTPIKQSNDN